MVVWDFFHQQCEAHDIRWVFEDKIYLDPEFHRPDSSFWLSLYKGQLSPSCLITRPFLEVIKPQLPIYKALMGVSSSRLPICFRPFIGDTSNFGRAHNS